MQEHFDKNIPVPPEMIKERKKELFDMVLTFVEKNPGMKETEVVSVIKLVYGLVG